MMYITTHGRRPLADVEYLWAAAILRDTATFRGRLDSWRPGASEAVWQQALTTDLDRRLLLPANGRSIKHRWSPRPGKMEAELYEGAITHWIAWRDQVIETGVTDPDSVYAVCAHLLEQMLDDPLAPWGGATPRQMIEAERKGVGAHVQ